MYDDSEQLIIGLGEVGKALQKVLRCDAMDIEPVNIKKYKVLHICFPYSNKFIKYVRDYKKAYAPELTVIHSTVPVGTSRKLEAIHSPITGVHPHLEAGIRTFVKRFGGKGGDLIARKFKKLGIDTKCYNKPEITEAQKLWDTTLYGLSILANKEIHEWCTKKGLDFEQVYTESAQLYNQGYTKLKRNDVIRPVLKYMKGKIGGHCVVPNCKLLDSWISKLIRKKNKSYGD